VVYALKTKPTGASVSSYLAAIEDESRRKDCRTLASLMKRVTHCRPKMWGPSIVGFDRYHYAYQTGHQGEWCIVGFSSGKAHISVYLLSGFESPVMKALLAQLGKHKTGKACLYIRRLSDVQPSVLEKLVACSVAEIKSRHAKAER